MVTKYAKIQKSGFKRRRGRPKFIGGAPARPLATSREGGRARNRPIGTPTSRSFDLNIRIFITKTHVFD